MPENPALVPDAPSSIRSNRFEEWHMLHPVDLDQTMICDWLIFSEDHTSRPLAPWEADRLFRGHHRDNDRSKLALAWLLLADGVEHLFDSQQLDMVVAIQPLTEKTAQSMSWYIGRRINRAFAPWIDSQLEFRELLRSRQSIVSGSVALKAVTAAEWPCSNMDIYVPSGWVRAKAAIIRFLVHTEQYVVVRESRTGNPQARKPFLKYVLSVTHLRRTVTTLQGKITRHIYIMQSTADATKPVASFSATWCMNWIGADEIVVQYPEMTLAGEGILNNPCSLDNSWSAIWLAKYASRGFHLMVDEVRWAGCLEVCYWRRSNPENDGSLSLRTSTYPEYGETPVTEWIHYGWKALGRFEYRCSGCSPYPVLARTPDYVRMYNEYTFSESDGGH